MVEITDVTLVAATQTQRLHQTYTLSYWRADAQILGIHWTYVQWLTLKCGLAIDSNVYRTGVNNGMHVYACILLPRLYYMSCLSLINFVYWKTLGSEVTKNIFAGSPKYCENVQFILLQNSFPEDINGCDYIRICCIICCYCCL